MNEISFLVTDGFGNTSPDTKNVIILTWDNWNDYSYYTIFGVDYIDGKGERFEIGAVRIAYFGQGEGASEKLLKKGDKFDKLDDNYFSLGSDDSYYENLNRLGEQIREKVLVSLNDIALDEELFERAIEEEVTQSSLLRDISYNVVTNQYRRIASGGVRLTDYKFRYVFPEGDVSIEPSHIEFDVVAESIPPSNIHLIVGRNGVGKSHLLNGMIDSILYDKKNWISLDSYYNENDIIDDISNLVSVTFSAFDEFGFNIKEDSEKIEYHCIGLRSSMEAIIESEQYNDFAEEFTKSIGMIVSTKKKDRWKVMVEALETDPIFKDENFKEIIDRYRANNKPIKDKFSKLSSGHKIILLTITRLVELLQEKSLVFIDEPETHLHPPLLASFVRALSKLLIDRNAVCIITTHSPIVLQEVPRSNTYKLSRKGRNAKFERLRIESFGENVGVLTNEIFGLEVYESGYYQLLKDLVDKNHSYEDVLEELNGKLGIEGKSILRSLFAEKEF